MISANDFIRPIFLFIYLLLIKKFLITCFFLKFYTRFYQTFLVVVKKDRVKNKNIYEIIKRLITIMKLK